MQKVTEITNTGIFKIRNELKEIDGELKLFSEDGELIVENFIEDPNLNVPFKYANDTKTLYIKEFQEGCSFSMRDILRDNDFYITGTVTENEDTGYITSSDNLLVVNKDLIEEGITVDKASTNLLTAAQSTMGILNLNYATKTDSGETFLGEKVWVVEVTSSSESSFLYNDYTILEANYYNGSVFIKGDSSFIGKTVNLIVYNATDDSVGTLGYTISIILTGEWQRVSGFINMPIAKTFRIMLRLNFAGGTLTLGDKVKVACMKAETGTYHTSWSLGGTTTSSGALYYPVSIFQGLQELSIRLKFRPNFDWNSINIGNSFSIFTLGDITYTDTMYIPNSIVCSFYGDSTKTFKVAPYKNSVGEVTTHSLLIDKQGIGIFKQDYVLGITINSIECKVYLDGILLRTISSSSYILNEVLKGILLGRHSRYYADNNSSITFKEKHIYQGIKSNDWFIEDYSRIPENYNHQLNTCLYGHNFLWLKAPPYYTGEITETDDGLMKTADNLLVVNKDVMNNGITVSKETTNLLSSDKSTMIYWGFNTGGSNFIATYNTNGGYNDLPSMDIEVINQSDTVLLVYYTTTLNTPQICSIYIKALNELAFNKNVYTYLWRNGTEISDSEGNTSYEYKRKWHYVTSAYSTNNFQAVRLTNLPAGAKIRISAPQVQLGTYPTPWVLGGTTRTHGKLMYSPSIWNGVGNEFTLRIKCKFNFGYDATNPDNVFGLFRTSISPGTYGSNDNFESYIVGDTTKTLVIRKRVSAVGSTVKSTVLSSSTWDNDHIITITAKNGTAYLYYDGVLLGSGDVSDVNWDLVFDGLILGSYSKDYTNYNSSITFKEVSIFKDAKSADWVKDNSSLYQCEDQNKNVILSYFDLATKVRPVTSEIKPIDKVLELADGTIYGPDLIASIDHIERGVVVSKATTNLAPSQIVNSYNNCSSTVNRSSTVLSEQLFGQNITRTTWSAINETGAVSIRTDIGKGCYFTGMTFVGQYAVSVYYRSNRTVNFNHQPTNQQIWDTSVHTDSYGNTWNRIKRRTLSTANATDFVYFGFTLPDYVLGEEFWIDFACFQIETGSYHTPFVLPNWNLLNYNQSCGNGTVSAGITEVNYTSGGYDNFEYSRLTLNTASDYQYTSFSVNPTIGEVISHGCWVKGSASAIGKRATFMYNTSTAAYFTFTITGEWQYVKYENYTVPKLNSYLRVYLYSWEANFAVNDHLDICQVQTVYGATVKQWRYGGPSRSAGKLLYPSSMFPTVNGGFALKVKPFFNYDTDSYKIFFQIGNADTSYNFFIGYRYETDKFYCVYKHNLVSTPILFLSDVFTDNESLQQDTYFHVFYDNTYLYVYVNGILKVTYDISSKPFSDMLAQRGYQIFGRYYDDTLQADSTFKEFMIFDRVLNSDEINYLIDN